MANIPEFISVLRWTRDTAYPEINTKHSAVLVSAAAALASEQASAISESNASDSESAASASATASEQSRVASAEKAGEAGVSAEAALASEQSAAADALIITTARESMKEPTGFNHSFPDQLGILQLCIVDPDDNTRFIIYGIDQNNDNIAKTNPLRSAATWYEGTAIGALVEHQIAQSPVDGITPITWWIDGLKYERTTIDIVNITVQSGIHYYYRDTVGLKEQIAFNSDLFKKYAYTAAIYGNAGTGEKVVFANERHGITMDGATHWLHHIDDGTAYGSGLGLVGLAIGSGVYTQIDGGEYIDEDISRIAPVQTNSPFWWIGGDTWRGLNDGLDLAYITNLRPNYNINVAGTWSLQEIANGKHTLIHFFVTNDVEFPVVKILGQAEYGNSADAKDGALNELKSMTLHGVPSPEFLPLFTIILDDAGNLVATDSGDLYVDWRQSDLTSTQGSGDTLPSQLGNDNKFLQTSGTNASWIDVDAYLGLVFEGL